MPRSSADVQVMSQAVEGQGDDGAAAFVDRDRVRERERLARRLLFDDAALVDQRGEGAGGTVDDGRLGGVELDDRVVHGHAAEGREHVLDGVQLDGVGGDGRLTLEFGDHLRDRAYSGLPKRSMRRKTRPLSGCRV
jgi:hypothetical protein